MAQGSLELHCRFAPRGASKAPGSIPGVVARHSPFPEPSPPPLGLRSKTPPGVFVTTNLHLEGAWW